MAYSQCHLRQTGRCRMFYVYIIETEDGTYYTGQTNDLLRRLQEHLSSTSKTAAYFHMHKPRYLVYLEELDSRSEAMRREREIKQNRRLKLSLIGNRRNLHEVIESEESYR
jgi:putative endonuclease